MTKLVFPGYLTSFCCISDLSTIIHRNSMLICPISQILRASLLISIINIKDMILSLPDLFIFVLLQLKNPILIEIFYISKCVYTKLIIIIFFNQVINSYVSFSINNLNFIIFVYV